MSKHELIEAIRRHNRTATVPFLMSFKEPQLVDYLGRLTLTQTRGSAWVRQSSDPAITVRDCLARRSHAA